jgi:hypothetical protein
LRPTTAAILIVAAGLLAALPFRRPIAEIVDEPLPAVATGPLSTAIDAVSLSRKSDWSGAAGFDPSLAWQPVPMAFGERPSPEMPPMPDSYYDLAFELEQPDLIRERFTAAVKNPTATGSTAQAASLPAELPYSSSIAQQPPRQHTMDELIKDRFVYTPIEPARSAIAEDQRNQRGTHAQSASMVRSGGSSSDDASRPRQFIREPQ